MTHPAGIQFHIDAKRDRRVLPFAVPLVLYAALLLVLSELFDAPFFIPAYLPGAAAIIVCALWKKRAGFLVFAGVGALLFLLLILRSGLMLLINRLYAVSEAVNAYAYDYFEVSTEDETAAIRVALAALCLLLGALCAAAAKYRWTTLILFIAVAALETVFGVTPALWKNILLFAAMALILVWDFPNHRHTVFLFAGAAVLALLVMLIAPRPNTSVERYSEHLRNLIEPVPPSAPQSTPLPEAERNLTHRESRQHEEDAQVDPAAQRPQQSFRRETELEQEISLPHRVDWLRIALLLLAVIALLIAPFLPFLLMNRARKRTEATRASFDDPDNAAAIRAMFSHLMTWLRRCGMETENRPFGLCESAVRTVLPEEYAARYAAAASIWQEAAYSGHSMTEEQRETVRLLLRDTAKLLYDRSDAQKRFRLKYIDCLCEG